MIQSELYYPGVSLRVSLPARPGGRPRTQVGIPYVQLDQRPRPEIALEVIPRSLNLPFVRTRQSRMASSGTNALTVPDAHCGGPREAFIDGHEFCHLHPPPECGIHLTLPGILRKQAIAMEWAEDHPVARLGAIPETVVMVYAPRDWEELEVVMQLIKASYEFARGI
jgi:hypothetical protein